MYILKLLLDWQVAFYFNSILFIFFFLSIVIIESFVFSDQHFLWIYVCLWEYFCLFMYVNMTANVYVSKCVSEYILLLYASIKIPVCIYEDTCMNLFFSKHLIFLNIFLLFFYFFYSKNTLAVSKGQLFKQEICFLKWKCISKKHWHDYLVLKYFFRWFYKSLLQFECNFFFLFTPKEASMMD